MRRNTRALRRPRWGRRSAAHITGDSVRATMVEMMTDTAMVMVNWR